MIFLLSSFVSYFAFFQFSEPLLFITSLGSILLLVFFDVFLLCPYDFPVLYHVFFQYIIRQCSLASFVIIIVPSSIQKHIVNFRCGF